MTVFLDFFALYVKKLRSISPISNALNFPLYLGLIWRGLLSGLCSKLVELIDHYQIYTEFKRKVHIYYLDIIAKNRSVPLFRFFWILYEKNNLKMANLYGHTMRLFV